MSDIQQQTHTIACKFIERAQALRYKGKKCDDAALDFFSGAAVSAEAAGNMALAAHLGAVCAMVIAVRGYIGIAQLADWLPDNTSTGRDANTAAAIAAESTR